MLRPLTFPLLILPLFLFSRLAFPEEEITYFQVDYYIEEKRTIRAVETIRVRTELNQVKHGILRSFPLYYQSVLGNVYPKIGYEMLTVQRNNHPEQFKAEVSESGIRYVIGDKYELLELGEHTFTLQYRLSNRIELAGEKETLTIDVFGNWRLPILSAIAVVKFPPKLSRGLIEHSGKQPTPDRKEKVEATKFTSTFQDDESLMYFSTAPLVSGEGLELSLSWPKGFIFVPVEPVKPPE